MVDKTPNQDLEKPEERETDWGIAIRNTYDKLDTILQGFSSDGKSLNIKEVNNVYYAKDFEGVDGGAMIQNALDYADSQPGKNRVVVGPVGPDNPSNAPEPDVWRVSTHIDPQGYNNTELIGEGWPMLFLADGADDDIIRPAYDASGTRTFDVRIEGFRFHGNKANQTVSSGRDMDGDGTDEIKGLCGIQAVNCENWDIKNCTFQNHTRHGFSVKLSEHVSVSDCWSTNNDDDGFTASNQFFNSQALSDIVFDRVYGFNNFDQGIEIEDGATEVTVRDSWFENNREGGTIKSHSAQTTDQDEQPCENISFENCVFVSNDAKDLRVYGTPQDVDLGISIDGCKIIVDGANAGLTVGIGNESAGTTVRGVTVSDTTIVVKNAANLNEVIDMDLPMARRDIDIDATIEIEDDASSAVGVRLEEGQNISLNLQIHGNGQLQHGIIAMPQEGDITDLHITDETYIENCLNVGAFLAGHSNRIARVRIGGTYKNNGHDTGSGSAGRSGVRIDQIASGPNITDVTLGAIQAYDDQGTQTQRRGLHVDECARIDAQNVNLFNNDGFDVYVGSAATDVSVSGDWADISDDGTRTVLNGWGENAGDPSTTGQWNGSGYEGAAVVDTSNSIKYVYRSGNWV